MKLSTPQADMLARISHGEHVHFVTGRRIRYFWHANEPANGGTVFALRKKNCVALNVDGRRTGTVQITTLGQTALAEHQ